MSLGVSVADFISVIDYANKIRKEFVEAPAQFKAISEEVRNLSFVVQDVEVDLTSKELNSKQIAELRDVAESCRNTLTDIENTIDGYRELVGRNTVKRVWKRLKWEPNDIRELRSRLSSNIALLNAFNGNITRRDVTKLVEHQDSHQRQEILDWLSPETYAAQQSDYIGRRQPGTGRWLLESPEFQTWATTPKQTLFCPGIPGAGKTILASTVVEELSTRYGTMNEIGIAYLYCNFQRHGEQNSTSLLASLLRQLAQSCPSIPDSLNILYEQHRARGALPSVDEISQTLDSICSHFSTIFVVVDALDECQVADRSRTRLLDEIFNLQTNYNLNFLATSRFIPEIAARFENKPSREIYASKLDVISYLTANLDRLPSFVSRNPELQDEITTEIAEGIDGMFLLAKLYFDSLAGKRSPKAMRSALKDISAGLKTYDSAYNGAMERIEAQLPDQREMAKQVLSWITGAKRPLTTTELQNALAIEHGSSEFDETNLPDLVDMVSVCAGLVTVDEQSDIIRLVHYTTQEYFQRTWTRWFSSAHHEIATSCVTYLSFDAFGVGSCSTDEELEARLRQYPVYSYAAKNWGKHCRTQHVDYDLAICLLGNASKLDACVQGLFAEQHVRGYTGYSQEVPKQFTGLHLAAYFGLESVVQRLVQPANDQTDATDSFGRTPLSWAAENGHEAVTEILLKSGALPDSKDGHSRTPLLWAARYGRTRVVQILLENGADADSRDEYLRTPLSYAASHGHEAIIKLLLGRNVEADARDEEERTPLSWAAFYGHEVVVQLLVDKAVDPKSKDLYGITPLSYAASNGSGNVVQFLLEKGADPDSKDQGGQTPLSHAASNGHDEVVRLLIERGVDLNSQDNEGRTPVAWATHYGHEPVVRLLFAKGADPRLSLPPAAGAIVAIRIELEEEGSRSPLDSPPHARAVNTARPDQDMPESESYKAGLTPDGRDLAGAVAILVPEPFQPTPRSSGRPLTYRGTYEKGPASGGRWICPLCPATISPTYSSRNTLKRHIEERHYPRYEFCCCEPHCADAVSRKPISFRRDRALEHFVKLHRRRPSFQELDQCRRERSHPPACVICSSAVRSWKEFDVCLYSHCFSLPSDVEQSKQSLPNFE